MIGDVTREVEYLSNDYTNPNTNPKPLTTLALTLADHDNAFESFCAPVFCDFVRNYSCTSSHFVSRIMMYFFIRMPDSFVFFICRYTRSLPSSFTVLTFL